MVVFIVLFFFSSCNLSKNDTIDLSNTKINLQIERFDSVFYNATKKNLPEIKKQFPYFFPNELTDSMALSKINNKDEQELFAETQKLYSNFSSVKSQLTDLFKHIAYYNKKFVAPKVITMLTNIDYENRVIYADSLLLISLDVYLGKNHVFYKDYPNYIKENNTKSHIVVDVANAIITKQMPRNDDRTFLGKIIHEGKKMYLLDVYLPSISEKEKIGYQQDKLTWAKVNEEQIWMYFIEKNLLFNTDSSLNSRFLETAPFSKFYIEQDKLSPGKIGFWLGWQMVKSYMKQNNVSLQELLNKSTIDIYKNSKYKPKK